MALWILPTLKEAALFVLPCKGELAVTAVAVPDGLFNIAGGWCGVGQWQCVCRLCRRVEVFFAFLILWGHLRNTKTRTWVTAWGLNY